MNAWGGLGFGLCGDGPLAGGCGFGRSLPGLAPFGGLPLALRLRRARPFGAPYGHGANPNGVRVVRRFPLSRTLPNTRIRKTGPVGPVS